jgi:hypothetical protein
MDRFWIYAGLLAGVGFGYALLSRSGPRLTRESRVLLIGDSLSVGLHPPLRAMARDAGIPYAHCGQSGARITQFVGQGPLANCVRNQLKSLQPTIAIVVLGTNDEAMHKSHAPSQLAAAEKLVQQLQQAGAEVLWVSPAKQFAKSNVVGPLERIAPHWFDSTHLGVPLADSIGHSTPRGYSGWAAKIWSHLCRQC